LWSAAIPTQPFALLRWLRCSGINMRSVRLVRRQPPSWTYCRKLLTCCRKTSIHVRSSLHGRFCQGLRQRQTFAADGEDGNTAVAGPHSQLAGSLLPVPGPCDSTWRHHLSCSLAFINASIVQGSVVGPPSYVVIASDLHRRHQENDMMKYADDTYM